MYDGMGWLEVEVLDLVDNKKAGWQMVWSLWGNQGDAWHKATVDLSVSLSALHCIQTC